MVSSGYLLLIPLVFLAGCSNLDYQNLDPQEFNEIILDDDVFVLDVHIPEQDHIKGTDAFISYDKIRDNIDKLPKDKNTKIAVYCRSGTMSEQASKDLIGLGYKSVYNLVGGRNAYTSYFGG